MTEYRFRPGDRVVDVMTRWYYDRDDHVGTILGVDPAKYSTRRIFVSWDGRKRKDSWIGPGSLVLACDLPEDFRTGITYIRDGRKVFKVGNRIVRLGDTLRDVRVGRVIRIRTNWPRWEEDGCGGFTCIRDQIRLRIKWESGRYDSWVSTEYVHNIGEGVSEGDITFRTRDTPMIRLSKLERISVEEVIEEIKDTYEHIGPNDVHTFEDFDSSALEGAFVVEAVAVPWYDPLERMIQLESPRESEPELVDAVYPDDV